MNPHWSCQTSFISVQPVSRDLWTNPISVRDLLQIRPVTYFPFSPSIFVQNSSLIWQSHWGEFPSPLSSDEFTCEPQIRLKKKSGLDQSRLKDGTGLSARLKTRTTSQSSLERGRQSNSWSPSGHLTCLTCRGRGHTRTHTVQRRPSAPQSDTHSSVIMLWCHHDVIIPWGWIRITGSQTRNWLLLRCEAVSRHIYTKNTQRREK